MRRRADVVLAEKGLLESRERAKAAILAGHVRVDGRLVTKAGEQIDPSADIEVLERERYVSRGGYKLEGALETFGLEVGGVRAIDVGASTGGFTDCLLQRGALHVCAIDVGYGQLAWSLRQDERVDVHERTNIRHAQPKTLGAPFDLAVIDVSFIGLRVILDQVVSMLGPQGELLALVKPQFEVGKGRVGKKGVVRDSEAHEEVLASVLEAIRARGMVVRGLTCSPIRGPEGNIEFWVLAALAGEDCQTDPGAVVMAAHEAFGV